MRDPKAYALADWTGYLNREEIDLLMKCARVLPKNPIAVNIGVGHGTSGLALMEAREDLTLYSIDVNDFPNPYGGLINERNAFENAGYWGQSRHHQIHGRSQDIGKTWANGPVDLVFIDGDHSLPGITGDCESWHPHVKRGGIMAFHDFRTPWIESTVMGYFKNKDEFGYAGNLRAFRVKHG